MFRLDTSVRWASSFKIPVLVIFLLTAEAALEAAAFFAGAFFLAAFFAGRLVSYSIYAGSARVLEEYTLGDAFMETLTSPLGIALQLLMLGALVALAKVNWAKVLAPKEAPEDSAR